MSTTGDLSACLQTQYTLSIASKFLFIALSTHPCICALSTYSFPVRILAVPTHMKLARWQSCKVSPITQKNTAEQDMLCSAARNHGRKHVGLPSRLASFDSSDSLPKRKQQSWWHKQSRGTLQPAPAQFVCCRFHTNCSKLCCFYTNCSRLCLIFWQCH